MLVSGRVGRFNRELIFNRCVCNFMFKIYSYSYMFVLKSVLSCIYVYQCIALFIFIYVIVCVLVEQRLEDTLSRIKKHFPTSVPKQEPTRYSCKLMGALITWEISKIRNGKGHLVC